MRFPCYFNFVSCFHLDFIYSLPKQCVGSFRSHCFPELCGDCLAITGIVEAYFVKALCISRALLGDVAGSVICFQSRIKDAHRTVLEMRYL